MKPVQPPQISVVLPVYNAADTLAQTLESILCQRHSAFEVIAVDDGSGDGTPDLLARYARRDARIRPVYPGRQGLVGALNTGLARARAPFIARMDADDIAHPDRLRLQHAFLESHPGIAAVGSLIRCFPRDGLGGGFRVYETWINSLRTPEAIAREIYIESPLVHPSVLIRRNALEAVGGYKDFGWPEDYDLWLRLHLSGRRFAKIPRTLLYWRESPGRLTRTDGRYSVENFLRAKARYLCLGPLSRKPRALIWGSGQSGRRLAKHLQRAGIELVAFVDVDPKKIGRTRRGAPIIGPADLLPAWRSAGEPLILAAVSSRGARARIRDFLSARGFVEGRDYLCVA